VVGSLFLDALCGVSTILFHTTPGPVTTGPQEDSDMLPKPPPRRGRAGFLYVPPYRIQGVSTAGEQTAIQVPELDICFDIGLCPRFALTSPYIALSHAHMDHIGGLPYYFSQRVFQKMGVGTVVCHREIASSIEAMMAGWVALEHHQTPHTIIPLSPGEETLVKPGIALRAIEVSHTVPALGFSVIEYREKLRQDLVGLPQEQIKRLKMSGESVTTTHAIPLLAYTGDTQYGDFLLEPAFAKPKVVITECTFFDPDHRERARVGKHLHLDDLLHVLEVWEAETIVIVHTSRRVHVEACRELLRKSVSPADFDRIHFLMDHRRNRERLEQQESILDGVE
jgi:ribonuclease Z